ncbi:hypothetical protein MY04_0769 [Flammeovirga sp. MY04]|uniref:hypothetical protein n=1 Tax=Flammeovirga sp. MY04 TaxID=1191459 RepID=UPI00080626EF|nr:hypothetical protein [Flammeovirga sp. MY04]ANQ48151.1 hypothetical protein MY04_0769 [Flammeovirga sp. MY04]
MKKLKLLLTVALFPLFCYAQINDFKMGNYDLPSVSWGDNYNICELNDSTYFYWVNYFNPSKNGHSSEYFLLNEQHQIKMKWHLYGNDQILGFYKLNDSSAVLLSSHLDKKENQYKITSHLWKGKKWLKKNKVIKTSSKSFKGKRMILERVYFEAKPSGNWMFACYLRDKNTNGELALSLINSNNKVITSHQINYKKQRSPQDVTFDNQNTLYVLEKEYRRKVNFGAEQPAGYPEAQDKYLSNHLFNYKLKTLIDNEWMTDNIKLDAYNVRSLLMDVAEKDDQLILYGFLSEKRKDTDVSHILLQKRQKQTTLLSDVKPLDIYKQRTIAEEYYKYRPEYDTYKGSYSFFIPRKMIEQEDGTLSFYSEDVCQYNTKDIVQKHDIKELVRKTYSFYGSIHCMTYGYKSLEMILPRFGDFNMQPLKVLNEEDDTYLFFTNFESYDQYATSYQNAFNLIKISKKGGVEDKSTLFVTREAHEKGIQLTSGVFNHNKFIFPEKTYHPKNNNYQLRMISFSLKDQNNFR